MADDDWRDWFRSWSHSDTYAHPHSPAGGARLGNARHAQETHQLRPSTIPHFDSPAGRHFPWGDALLDAGLHMPSSGRSILLWLISKHSKVGQPFATALLRHYIGGSGEPYDLSETGPIPQEWQSWIAKATGAKLGKHHLNPYNAKPLIPDLKNSLGHFDVIVTGKAGSNIRIYEIEKNPYHFGFTQ